MNRRNTCHRPVVMSAGFQLVPNTGAIGKMSLKRDREGVGAKPATRLPNEPVPAVAAQVKRSRSHTRSFGTHSQNLSDFQSSQLARLSREDCLLASERWEVGEGKEEEAVDLCPLVLR